MRTRLQLATLFTGLTAATALHAQISNPSDLVAPVPHRRDVPERQAAKPDNPEWLWEYTKPLPNGRADQLRFDERFGAMLDENFKQAQALWSGSPSKQVPLAEVIPRFVARYSTVTAEKNRYITLDGCVPSFCAAHGMLWVDLGVPTKPLMVFAAVNWSTERHTTDDARADYYLWLFPNRYISSDALPLRADPGHRPLGRSPGRRAPPCRAHQPCRSGRAGWFARCA